MQAWALCQRVFFWANEVARARQQAVSRFPQHRVFWPPRRSGVALPFLLIGVWRFFSGSVEAVCLEFLALVHLQRVWGRIEPLLRTMEAP